MSIRNAIAVRDIIREHGVVDASGFFSYNPGISDRKMVAIINGRMAAQIHDGSMRPLTPMSVGDHRRAAFGGYAETPVPLKYRDIDKSTADDLLARINGLQARVTMLEDKIKALGGKDDDI